MLAAYQLRDVPDDCLRASAHLCAPAYPITVRGTMSLQDVRLMVAKLPRSLADQVIGYAESVERALPEIFTEARRRRTAGLANQVIFIAGLRKLHWLAASSYWTLDNSGKLLQAMDVTRIQIGKADVYRGSETYTELHALLVDLEQLLTERHLLEHLQLSWPELIRELVANGRQ